MTDQRFTAASGIGDEGRRDRSIGQLVADATEDLSILVRGEIELAKIELKQTAVRAVAGSVLFIVAGTFAFFALIMLLFAFAYGLVGLGVWTWLAFLIVALVLVLVGALLGWLGYRKVKSLGPPTRTIEAGKAAVAAAKPGRDA